MGSQPKATLSNHPGMEGPNLGSGWWPHSQPHTVPSPPRLTFGTGNCKSVAGLGLAASLAETMSGSKRERPLHQIRPEGTGGQKEGLWWASGWHL